jgi:hypothetical protein
LRIVGCGWRSSPLRCSRRWCSNREIRAYLRKRGIRHAPPGEAGPQGRPPAPGFTRRTAAGLRQGPVPLYVITSSGPDPHARLLRRRPSRSAGDASLTIPDHKWGAEGVNTRTRQVHGRVGFALLPPPHPLPVIITERNHRLRETAVRLTDRNPKYACSSQADTRSSKREGRPTNKGRNVVEETRRAWGRVVRWLEENAPGNAAALAPPASQDEIAAAENAIGVTYFRRARSRSAAGRPAAGGWTRCRPRSA